MIVSATNASGAFSLTYALCRPQTRPKAEFVPPPFESEAQQGVPDVPEELGYSSPDRDDMSYDFAVCGKRLG